MGDKRKCGFSVWEWLVIIVVGVALVPAFVGIPILLGAWLYNRKKKEECRREEELMKDLVNELKKLRKDDDGVSNCLHEG